MTLKEYQELIAPIKAEVIANVPKNQFRGYDVVSFKRLKDTGYAFEYQYTARIKNDESEVVSVETKTILVHYKPNPKSEMEIPLENRDDTKDVFPMSDLQRVIGEHYIYWNFKKGNRFLVLNSPRDTSKSVQDDIINKFLALRNKSVNFRYLRKTEIIAKSLYDQDGESKDILERIYGINVRQYFITNKGTTNVGIIQEKKVLRKYKELVEEKKGKKTEKKYVEKEKWVSAPEYDTMNLLGSVEAPDKIRGKKATYGYVYKITDEESTSETDNRFLPFEIQKQNRRSIFATYKRQAESYGTEMRWSTLLNPWDNADPNCIETDKYLPTEIYLDIVLDDPLKYCGLWVEVKDYEFFTEEFGDTIFAKPTIFINKKNQKQEIVEKKLRSFYNALVNLDDYVLTEIVGITYNGKRLDKNTYIYENSKVIQKELMPLKEIYETIKPHKITLLDTGLDVDHNEEYVLSPTMVVDAEDGRRHMIFLEPIVQQNRRSSNKAVFLDKVVKFAYMSNLETMSKVGVKVDFTHMDDARSELKGEFVKFYDELISRKIATRNDIILVGGAKKFGTTNGIIGRQDFINSTDPDYIWIEDGVNNRRFIKEARECIEGTQRGKRDERKGINKLNIINSREYSFIRARLIVGSKWK